MRGAHQMRGQMHAFATRRTQTGHHNKLFPDSFHLLLRIDGRACAMHVRFRSPRVHPASTAAFARCAARTDPRGLFARCAAFVLATDIPSPDSGVARSLFLCSCQRAAGLARCAAGLDRRRQRRRACSFAAAPPGSLPRLRRGRAAGSVTAPFLGLRGSGRLAVVLPASRAVWGRCDNVLILLDSQYTINIVTTL